MRCGWAVEEEELPDGGGEETSRCDLRCGLARVGDAQINRPCTLPAVPSWAWPCAVFAKSLHLFLCLELLGPGPINDHTVDPSSSQGGGKGRGN